MNSSNCVFVLDTAKRPLTPCRPAQARRMLRDGKAAVYRRFPFTVILKAEKPEAVVQTMTVKIDPGSKTTGVVLVDSQSRVLFAAELEHRGKAIKKALAERRMYRRNRRARNTRYREARFDHRTRPAGWLPPSLQHRVDTTMAWVNRFRHWAPVDELAFERVKFDTQLMQNPKISGIEYQKGTLQGYTVREYLLEKWGRKCVYCGAGNTPLNIDHIHPKAKGGTDRVSNLTLACVPCNQKKSSQDISDFLARKPEVLAKIKRQAKAPLSDTSAVNATRNALFAALLATGLPVETGDGARTKFNRTRQGYPKAHWIDAACVGVSGATVTLDVKMKPLHVKTCGHGVRQRCRPDAFGFPRPAAPRAKKFLGFQTGDLVAANLPTGKYAGNHTGRIAIRHRPCFVLQTASGKFDVHPRHLSVIQKADGYAYS